MLGPDLLGKRTAFEETDYSEHHENSRLSDNSDQEDDSLKKNSDEDIESSNDIHSLKSSRKVLKTKWVSGDTLDLMSF